MSIDYERMFDITKRKIFDDIFNYSDIILQNNIKLTPLNKGKAVRGMIYTNVLVAMMPEPKRWYYLFLCDNVTISNLLFSAKGWTDMETILNREKVSADFFTQTNRMIPKCMIYGHIEHSGVTILAIDARVYKQFESTLETYMVINLDTDVVGDRTVISHIPKVNENISTVLTTVQQKPVEQLICCINGYVYPPDQFRTVGDHLVDYYELYHDGNIKCTFVVDLDQRNTYLSTEEALYKDIIVIPRELIGNQVFTYDTVSIVVREHGGKGILLPYLADMSVSQLTHTSFSVSSYLIDAAFDELGITTGELYVIVSNYSKNNVHVPNGSITEQMYQLDDTKLMEAFLENLEPNVPYWSADALEQRTYGKYLTEMEELKEFEMGLLPKQIDCLGYYPFAQLLCSYTGTIDDVYPTISQLILPIPVFLEENEILPLLYLDGVHIAPDRFTYQKVGDTIEVTMDLPIPVDFSYSKVCYVLTVIPSTRVYQHVVDPDHMGIVLPKHEHSEILVYRKENVTVKGLTVEPHQGYSALELETNKYFAVTQDDATYFVVFKEYALDDTFVFQYDTAVISNYFPNVDISNGRSLTYTPECLTEENVVLPVLFEGTYDVHLNGRFMIPGIDYIVSEIRDDLYLGGYQIVIQNLKFMKEGENNTVGFYKTDQHILSHDVGYVVDGIIPKNANNEAWFQGISRLYVNGKIVPFDAVTEHPTHYVVDERHCGNGQPYYFVNAVPNVFYNAYRSYMNEAYFDGRNQVHTYFTHDYNYEYPELIVINNGHKIFSAYLNEVIHRILDGTIWVNYINDDEDIVNQLRDYEDLKRFDVLFQIPNEVDTRFVDRYPGYVSNVMTTDLNKYLYIRRLVKIYLGDDDITDHMVVYTGH